MIWEIIYPLKLKTMFPASIGIDPYCQKETETISSSKALRRQR